MDHDAYDSSSESVDEDGVAGGGESITRAHADDMMEDAPIVQMHAFAPNVVPLDRFGGRGVPGVDCDLRVRGSNEPLPLLLPPVGARSPSAEKEHDAIVLAHELYPIASDRLAIHLPFVPPLAPASREARTTAWIDSLFECGYEAVRDTHEDCYIDAPFEGMWGSIDAARSLAIALDAMDLFYHYALAVLLKYYARITNSYVRVRTDGAFADFRDAASPYLLVIFPSANTAPDAVPIADVPLRGAALAKLACEMDFASFFDLGMARLHARGRILSVELAKALVFSANKIRRNFVQTMSCMRFRSFVPRNLEVAMAPAVVRVSKTKFAPHPLACNMVSGVVAASAHARATPVPLFLAHVFLDYSTAALVPPFAYPLTAPLADEIDQTTHADHQKEMALLWNLALYYPLASLQHVCARARTRWSVETVFPATHAQRMRVYDASLPPLTAVRARFCLYVRGNKVYAYVPNLLLRDADMRSGRVMPLDESCPSQMSLAAFRWNVARGAAITQRQCELIASAASPAALTSLDDHVRAHNALRNHPLDVRTYGFGRHLLRSPADPASMPPLTPFERGMMRVATPQNPWLFYWSLLREYESEPCACFILAQHGVSFDALRASSMQFRTNTSAIAVRLGLRTEAHRHGVRWDGCGGVAIPLACEGTAFEMRWRALYPTSTLAFEGRPWIHQWRAQWMSADAPRLILAAVAHLIEQLSTAAVRDELTAALQQRNRTPLTPQQSTFVRIASELVEPALAARMRALLAP